MFLILYNAVLFISYPVYYFLSLVHPSIRKFRKSRIEGYQKFQRWLNQNKDTQKKIVWLHGSSVGEVDQALGILDAIKKESPDTLVIMSAFSLSAKVKKIENCELFFYLPLDHTWIWHRLFQDKTVDVFITMTWDVFPNLINALSKKKCSTYLCSASIDADNWKMSSFWTKMHAPIYNKLSGIGCVNADSLKNFSRLYSCPSQIKVTGDSRFDTIFKRISRTTLDKNYLAWWQKFKTPKSQIWILASTYMTCESAIIPILPELLERFKNLKVVIFPHKIHPQRIQEISSLLKENELEHSIYTKKPTSFKDSIVIMDQMGKLALSYKFSDICYVGGGFGKRVHNTAEPAALKNVILTGPHIDWSGIALELEKTGSLVRCSNQQMILEKVTDLLGHPKQQKLMAKKAAAYLKNSAGSSDKFYAAFLKKQLS